MSSLLDISTDSKMDYFILGSIEMKRSNSVPLFNAYSTLSGVFSRLHIEIFFLVFPGNRFWYFTQMVSKGDQLHEMPKPVFWKLIFEKYCQFVVCWISQGFSWWKLRNSMRPKISNILIDTFLCLNFAFLCSCILLYFVKWQTSLIYVSSLIRVCTVWISQSVRNFGIQNFRIFTINIGILYFYSTCTDLLYS